MARPVDAHSCRSALPRRRSMLTSRRAVSGPGRRWDLGATCRDHVLCGGHASAARRISAPQCGYPGALARSASAATYGRRVKHAYSHQLWAVCGPRLRFPLGAHRVWAAGRQRTLRPSHSLTVYPFLFRVDTVPGVDCSRWPNTLPSRSCRTPCGCSLSGYRPGWPRAHDDQLGCPVVGVGGRHHGPFTSGGRPAPPVIMTAAEAARLVAPRPGRTSDGV
jgi:hypothetical protein